MFAYALNSLWLTIFAFGLDMWLGHLQTWWRHPVCYIGDLLRFIEPIARKFGDDAKKLRMAGFLCVIFTVGTVGFVVWFLTSLPYIGVIFTFYFAYSGLATKSLLTFFDAVLDSVEHASLEDAQKAVAQLVSRDTTVLDRDALRKTLADTFSENFTDAVVAPLFWLILGGPVALWMYKAVSTMDSMWGYKAEPWTDLGFAGAKADDVLAYIPARLSVFILQSANEYENITKKTGGMWPGWKCIFGQAQGMPSPNSGLPMACAAWLMNGRLAGPSVYFGAVVEKPWLGPPKEDAKPWDKQRLMHLATLIKVGAYAALINMSLTFFGILTLGWVFGD